ncbi:MULTISPECIES: shikimate kinase [unclassified Blautia]|uniref:shikimate kinase n=1 Tax=unclassified Blautia TaxID=2648079 RepID=UPI000B3894B8|nr:MULTISPECIES: shikimate kinase [unclassified Blautia]OUN31540.1 shikimate kinase [Blautia sp. An81]OUN93125.1 shikimate kinase [Blautia sp. An46]HJD36368.1 shikimate kinase [Candidatus Blautia ornithocaccae]
MKDNIVLIGMPGSGKSTVGVILAKVLGYSFIDSDLLIQKAEKKLLKEIIAREGQEGFLKIENRVNASIETEKSVIATGGSVVYCQEAMEHLKEIGTVIYLQLDYPILRRRLGNLIGRGVVLKEGQTLKDLYEERVPLYEKYADYIIDEKKTNAEGTLQKILEILN